MGKKKSSKKKYYIGIDLGGTKMLIGVLKKDFTVLATEKVKVHPDEGEKFFLKTLKEALLKVLEDARTRGELPVYLQQPISDLRSQLGM